MFDSEYPSLIGTDEQVSRASEIRNSVLCEYHAAIEKVLIIIDRAPNPQVYYEALVILDVSDRMYQNQSANWWIENSRNLISAATKGNVAIQQVFELKKEKK